MERYTLDKETTRHTSEEERERRGLYVFLTSPCTMNRWAIVMSFVALVLEANAIIHDSSMIYSGPSCTSELRVRIEGIGIDSDKDEVRYFCEESCREDAEKFKNDRCPQLCGISVPPTPRCYLCHPSKPYYVSMCRNLIDAGVTVCQMSCQTAPIVNLGSKYRVTTFVPLRRMFPGKYT